MSGIFKRSGKQLDKFTQSVGERIFREDKTELSPAFRDLESVVELRRLGTERLAISSRDYLSAIGKKEKIQDGAVLPVELLGLNQLTYGTDLGDSDYAASLASLGRAHCKIGSLTERFVEEVQVGYQSGLERSVDTMKDYHALRKKLDSRRLTMDSAIKKRDSSKKGDPAKLEEEVEAAVARFEESHEEVEIRMQAISESDASHHADLYNFLEAELELVEQIREELLRVKSGWVQSQPSNPPPAAARSRPPPLMRRSVSSYKNKAVDVEAEENDDSSFKANRARSNSTKSTGGTSDKEKKSLFGSLAGRKKVGRPRGNTWGSLQNDQDGESMMEEPPSIVEERIRPTSFMSRSRSASSSVTLSSFANTTAPSASPRPTPPALPRRATTALAEPEPDARQHVKAKFQFDATASDELSLSVGDVVVIDEVISGDWFIGTKVVGGASGLFPSAYTSPTSPPLPFLPPRPTLVPPQNSSGNSSRTGSRPPLSAAHSSASYSSDISDHRDPYATSEGSEDERFNEKKTLTTGSTPTTSRSVSTSFGSYGKKSAPPPPPRRQTITRRDEDEDENPFS